MAPVWPFRNMIAMQYDVQSEVYKPMYAIGNSWKIETYMISRKKRQKWNFGKNKTKMLIHAEFVMSNIENGVINNRVWNDKYLTFTFGIQSWKVNQIVSENYSIMILGEMPHPGSIILLKLSHVTGWGSPESVAIWDIRPKLILNSSLDRPEHPSQLSNRFENLQVPNDLTID